MVRIKIVGLKEHEHEHPLVTFSVGTVTNLKHLVQYPYSVSISEKFNASNNYASFATLFFWNEDKSNQ